MPPARQPLTAADRVLMQLIAQERGFLMTVHMPAGISAQLRTAGLITRTSVPKLTPTGRTRADQLVRAHGLPEQDPRTHSLGSGSKPPSLLA